MKESQVLGPAELFDLSGRTAYITGGSSGLGARFVRVLAAAGAQVVVGARRADRLAELYDSMDSVRWVACDVAEDQDRTRFLHGLGDLSHPPILVNNAAVAGPLAIADESPDQFSDLLRVNLTACYALAREMVEGVRDPRGTSIVNVSSILGLVAGAPMGGAGYTASKAGLIGLTRELAAQWGSAGVLVNALAPGWFDTEMTGGLLNDDGGARWIRRNTMLGRPGAQGELDTALLLLASPRTSYLTGQVLTVDGGWTAR